MKIGRKDGREETKSEREERRKEGQKKRWEGGREEVKKERGRHSRRKAGMSDGKMDIVIKKWGVWGDLFTDVFLSPKMIKINRIN